VQICALIIKKICARFSGVWAGDINTQGHCEHHHHRLPLWTIFRLRSQWHMRQYVWHQHTSWHDSSVWRRCRQLQSLTLQYSGGNTFWAVKKLADLADGPTLAGPGHEPLYCRPSDSRLAIRLDISQAKNLRQHCVSYYGNTDCPQITVCKVKGHILATTPYVLRNACTP
jgi:hypothetical protein